MHEQFERSNLVVINNLWNVQLPEHQTQRFPVFLYKQCSDHSQEATQRPRTAHFVLKQLLDDDGREINVNRIVYGMTWNALRNRAA